MHVHTCIHTCSYTQVQCAYMHTYMYNVHTCIHTCTMCIHAYTQVQCAYMHTYMYNVHTCIHTCTMCIHAYIHVQCAYISSHISHHSTSLRLYQDINIYVYITYMTKSNGGGEKGNKILTISRLLHIHYIPVHMSDNAWPSWNGTWVYNLIILYITEVNICFMKTKIPPPPPPPIPALYDKHVESWHCLWYCQLLTRSILWSHNSTPPSAYKSSLIVYQQFFLAA